jgi:hypothetical protein
LIGPTCCSASTVFDRKTMKVLFKFNSKFAKNLQTK